jgi:hypothetical protein
MLRIESRDIKVTNTDLRKPAPQFSLTETIGTNGKKRFLNKKNYYLN